MTVKEAQDQLKETTSYKRKRDLEKFIIKQLRKERRSRRDGKQ